MALPIKMPVDNFFRRSWEFDTIFAGVENPRLVSQSFGDSIIEEMGARSIKVKSSLALSTTLYHEIGKHKNKLLEKSYLLRRYIYLKILTIFKMDLQH